MHSCHYVNIKLKFRSHSFTLSIYSFSQNFEVNCPSTRQRSFITLLANPVAPSLKFMTAELIPNSRVFPPMKTSFGSLFHTTPFKHSLLFWILPRRQLWLAEVFENRHYKFSDNCWYTRFIYANFPFQFSCLVLAPGILSFITKHVTCIRIISHAAMVYHSTDSFLHSCNRMTVCTNRYPEIVL